MSSPLTNRDQRLTDWQHEQHRNSSLPSKFDVNSISRFYFTGKKPNSDDFFKHFFRQCSSKLVGTLTQILCFILGLLALFSTREIMLSLVWSLDYSPNIPTSPYPLQVTLVLLGTHKHTCMIQCYSGGMGAHLHEAI